MGESTIEELDAKIEGYTEKIAEYAEFNPPDTTVPGKTVDDLKGDYWRTDATRYTDTLKKDQEIDHLGVKFICARLCTGCRMEKSTSGPDIHCFNSNEYDAGVMAGQKRSTDHVAKCTVADCTLLVLPMNIE